LPDNRLSYGEVVGALFERKVNVMTGKRQLADDDIRSPADELTQDMKKMDFVFVLENLKFGKQTTATKPILLDRGVRDYLVRVLSPIK
jgi:hypothetical protein